jgi:tetrahydromethanopterin:alpha-L-glutamate ligase
MQRIPVFTDDAGWHGARLAEAFQRQGLQAVFVSLKDCVIDLSQSQPQIQIPQFTTLPKQVFVRGVPGGTLQQVIARLDVLHMLEMLGVRVVNSGRAIERTVDKAMTSFLLHRAGIPSPATWVCESRQHAHQLMQTQLDKGELLVIKPLFGSQGKGVRKIQQGDVLPVPMEMHVDGLYYLQRYINSGEGEWHDYRVFVVRNKAIAAMTRHGTQWINNVAQGASCSPCHNPDVIALAEAASKALEIDYCGVDIIQEKSGQYYVLEVNGIPAWKGLQGVAEVDVAERLVGLFLN